MLALGIVKDMHVGCPFADKGGLPECWEVLALQRFCGPASEPTWSFAPGSLANGDLNN